MTSKEVLKDKVCALIEENADAIVRIAKTILDRPETGFREVRTATLVADLFKKAGLKHRRGLAITGVKGELTGGSNGPTVAVLGELDSLIVSEHPHADPVTGAAHACGHHAQIGMLFGAVYGLMAPEVLDQLSGRIIFFAVPAEEYIEIEYRDELRRAGKLEFLGGKPELIRLGEFDDVDMALMCHTNSVAEEKKMTISGTNNGTLAKRVRFIGHAAHAGGAPHLGVNALNAASLALMAIHANRETFIDQDTVRVHPILTKGGEAVSSIPADVRMETFVRGANVEAILDANHKVDRALKAGAMSVGAQVEITTIPGYLPLRQDPNMMQMFKENAKSLVGKRDIGKRPHSTGSTDMGDLSQIMPAIHPYVGGATGLGHGKNYLVEDYDLAVVTAAKSLATTIVDLLSDGASGATIIKERHNVGMTKDKYLQFMRHMGAEERYNPEKNDS